MKATLPLIKVVGTSAGGKSTLVQALRAQGINARAASQEHSQIPDMWQRLHPPDLLIFLETDLAHQRQRRPDVGWTSAWLHTERRRLHHARLHADFHLNTSQLTPAQVLRQILDFLAAQGIQPGAPLPPRPPTGGIGRR